MDFISAVDSVLWGYVLVVLLLATGIFLTVVLRGIQFKQLGPALYLALITRKESLPRKGTSLTTRRS
jgi:AGCS family alanine or glycine:cation symporter